MWLVCEQGVDGTWRAYKLATVSSHVALKVNWEDILTAEVIVSYKTVLQPTKTSEVEASYQFSAT